MEIITPFKDKSKTPDFQFSVFDNNKFNPQTYDYVYNSDPPKLKSIGKINYIYELHDLISTSLEIIAPYRESSSSNIQIISSPNVDQSISEHGIFFAPDFPEFLLPSIEPNEYQSSPQVARNVITWGVVRQEPGSVSGRPFEGEREIKARHREFIILYGNKSKKYKTDYSTEFKHSSEKLGYMKVKAQYLDNLVQYNIWGRTNYEAERLVEWFKQYMSNYIGLFRKQGIVHMYYDRRVRDDTLIQMKNGYHLRSVLYYIRTEEVMPEVIGPINQINVNINVEELRNLITEENENIDPKHDKIVSEWVKKYQIGG